MSTPIADQSLTSDDSDALEAADPDTAMLDHTASEPPQDTPKQRRYSARHVIAFIILPIVAIAAAAAAGYAKWQDGAARATDSAAVESVRAATDGTIAMLGYRAESVEKDLGAARDRLTGSFLNSYTALTHDVVIPGAKQKHISAEATVPAVAVMSVGENHATVLVFVNQTTTIGNDAPTNSAASIKVTLDRVDSRWLISGFDPV